MIAFRADANEYIATGHLFRCISIAKCCAAAGEECIFLLAEDAYTDKLKQENIPYHILNVRWDDWDSGISKVRQSIKKYGIDCLVVDSYQATGYFFEQLSSEVPVFYLDDLCKERYHLSGVLHYSEWENEHTIEKLYRGSGVNIYAGMKYVPLREGFVSEHNEYHKIKKIYDLLITTGGSDTYHMTWRLLQKILERPWFERKSCCIVMGTMNRDDKKIKELCRNYSNITVMQNINNMNEVMRQSRCAVTAGGTTVYELMASGVPFVCFGFSDDQVYFGRRLEEHENGLWAGDAREDAQAVAEQIMLLLEKMHRQPVAEKEKLIRRNKKLVDGKGAERIADIIKELIKNKNC